MLKKILILLTLSSFLSGCATFRLFDTEEVDADGALVCKIPYDFQEPQPINMRDVKFYVLTPEKMREIINGNPEDLPIVYYGLSVEGYESMSYNMLEINRFLEANKILFQEIRNYYTPKQEESEK
jgi:outer membrane lipoprotein-sorting protein